MATVTKKDLVMRIAEATGCKKAVVKLMVQDFLHEIVKELAQGNRLEFRDFGVFEVRRRGRRKARNPRTGACLDLPPRATVHFKPGRLLREPSETGATRPSPQHRPVQAAPLPPAAGRGATPGDARRPPPP
jgi:integration host factor subunit beta